MAIVIETPAPVSPVTKLLQFSISEPESQHPVGRFVDRLGILICQSLWVLAGHFPVASSWLISTSTKPRGKLTVENTFREVIGPFFACF
jgi:hypothetical protein